MLPPAPVFGATKLKLIVESGCPSVGDTCSGTVGGPLGPPGAPGAVVVVVGDDPVDVVAVLGGRDVADGPEVADRPDVADGPDVADWLELAGEPVWPPSPPTVVVLELPQPASPTAIATTIAGAALPRCTRRLIARSV